MNRSIERRIRRIRRVARRHPALDSLASKAGTQLWKYQLARRSRGASGAALGKLVAIDPCRVNRFIWRLDLLDQLGMRQRDLVGQSIGGDWDTTLPLEELGIFEALRQRFEDGAEWADIPYFQEMRASTEAGRPQFKYRTVDDFERQWQRIDALWERLQRDGYRSQAELGTDRPWDEVVIGFDRDGRTVFVDGRHRLALARVMGLESIPAFVAIRHDQWIRRVAEFTTHIGDHSRISYQPVPHPDLADFPSKKGHERPQMILDALPIRSGRLLDIGSNKGYLCHRFEDAGFECVASERSERELHFLRMFHRAGERRFEIRAGDVLQQDFDGGFDVVLALNIFHHFLKEAPAMRALEAFLGRLDTAFMAFEPHLSDDPQMRAADYNPTPEEFTAFVQEAAGLPYCKPLGDAADGRPLYLLSRDPLSDAATPGPPK